VEETGLPRENRRPVANHCRLQLKGPFVLNKERFFSIVFGKRFEYDDEKFDNFVFAITETVINKYIPKVNLFPVLRFVPGEVFRVQQCFPTTLTKRLASSAIVDSIDVLPNPKPLNKFNVNALCSFHGCAAANPVPGIKMYICDSIYP
jgi:hypothetical protein